MSRKYFQNLVIFYEPGDLLVFLLNGTWKPIL